MRKNILFHLPELLGLVQPDSTDMEFQRDGFRFNVGATRVVYVVDEGDEIARATEHGFRTKPSALAVDVWYNGELHRTNGLSHWAKGLQGTYTPRSFREF